MKWKSSISIFYYQPVVDENISSESTITYLKIACSITGYQIDENELGVKVNKSNEWDKRVWAKFNEMKRTYFPCYGAILQVSVLPGDLNISSVKYPHITNF